MPDTKVKQIQIGSSVYDIEPANSANLSSADITNALGYTPIEHLEKTVTDTTNNFKGYAGLLEKRKVYTDVLGLANTTAKANTWANRSVYYITLRPISWKAQWGIKYHINVHLDNENQQYKSSSSASTVYPGKELRSTHYGYLGGGQGVFRTYSSFNSINNTSYRGVYYTMIHETTEAGYNAGRGHKIGVCLSDSYNSIPVTDYSSGSAVANTRYGRTIEVVIDECINCEAVLNEYLEVESDSILVGTTYAGNSFVALESTYYTTSTGPANEAGRWTYITNLPSNGLYETGDDNTIDRTQISAAYLVNGSKYNNAGTLTGMRCLSYSLLGFDKDGNALVISAYSASQTSRTTSISPKGTRIYEAVGFDYTKGLYYQNSSAVIGPDANMDISPCRYYSGLDFRYTDNCIPSSSATTLGMLPRKPVYLRGTLGSDGLFYLAPLDVTYNNQTYQRAWTQDIPTTEDGYVYWMIGWPYYNGSYVNSQYQFDLFSDTSLMWFKDGSFRPYGGAGETYTASKGITITSGNDIQHTNNITAQTTQGVYPVKIDAQGHISAYGSAISSFTPSSHTHGSITNDGKLGTASKIVVTDASKNITTGSKAEADLLTGLTTTTTASGNIAFVSTVTQGALSKSTTSILSYVSASTSNAGTGLSFENIASSGDVDVISTVTQTPVSYGTTSVNSYVSASTSNAGTGLSFETIAASGDVDVVASISQSDISAPTLSAMTSMAATTTVPSGVVNIPYVADISSTGASASGTTSVLTGFSAGSGAFTPTTKYLRLVTGTALNSSTKRYLTSAFTGTKTNALVTGVSVASEGAITMAGTIDTTTSPGRNILVISASQSGTSLTVTKGDYTPAGTIAHTANSSTSGLTGYATVIVGTGSGSFATGFRNNTSATTTGETAVTWATYVESATHSHVVPSYGAANQATVVTGVTGGETTKTTKYITYSVKDVVKSVSGGVVTPTTKHLHLSKSAFVTAVNTTPVTVANSVSGGDVSATTKHLHLAKSAFVTSVNTTPTTVVTNVSGGAITPTTSYLKGVK